VSIVRLKIISEINILPTNFEVLASLLAGGQEYPFSKKEKCYF